MNYESLLKNYLLDDQNKRYAVRILEKLTDQYRHGKIAEIRREGTMIEKMNEVIDFLVKDAVERRRYTSSIIPTVVSFDQAPNFWFKNEKAPASDEIYHALYVLLTGLYQGNHVINLENVDELVISEFRQTLKAKNIIVSDGNSGGIDMKKLRNALGIRVFPNTEFGFTLLMLSYFVYWIKEKKQGDSAWIRSIKELGLSSALSELHFDDTISLTTFNIRRQKKEMYITPRLFSFISRWYQDYLIGNENSPYVLSFLSSIYVFDKKYRKVSDPLMNKFIYYLLRENINGELLTDLLSLKIKFELKEREGRRFPISQARKFFDSIAIC